MTPSLPDENGASSPPVQNRLATFSKSGSISIWHYALIFPYIVHLTQPHHSEYFVSKQFSRIHGILLLQRMWRWAHCHATCRNWFSFLAIAITNELSSSYTPPPPLPLQDCCLWLGDKIRSALVGKSCLMFTLCHRRRNHCGPAPGRTRTIVAQFKPSIICSYRNTITIFHEACEVRFLWNGSKISTSV